MPEQTPTGRVARLLGHAHGHAAPMCRVIAACGAIMVLAGGILLAQSVDDFDSWMRTIDERIQSVQVKIAAKDASGVTEDAKTLQDTFKRVEEFWTTRGNAADAVDLSKQAGARAAEVVKAAADKDFDRASSQSIAIADTCTTCHRLYRPLP